MYNYLPIINHLLSDTINVKSPQYIKIKLNNYFFIKLMAVFFFYRDNNNGNMSCLMFEANTKFLNCSENDNLSLGNNEQ